MMQRLTTKLQGGTDAFGMPLVTSYDLDLQTAQGRIKTKCTLGRMEDILYAPDGSERITLDRLREIVDADADGRCVVLPCKVGTKVWLIPNYTAYFDDIEEATIQGVATFYNNGQMDVLLTTGLCLCVDWTQIGKTVFLTRAAAEQAKGERE
jgi:hypothetical protein